MGIGSKINYKNYFNSKNRKFNEAETSFKFLNNSLDLRYNFNEKYINFYKNMVMKKSELQHLKNQIYLSMQLDLLLF